MRSDEEHDGDAVNLDELKGALPHLLYLLTKKKEAACMFMDEVKAASRRCGANEETIRKLVKMMHAGRATAGLSVKAAELIKAIVLEENR